MEDRLPLIFDAFGKDSVMYVPSPMGVPTAKKYSAALLFLRVSGLQFRSLLKGCIGWFPNAF